MFGWGKKDKPKKNKRNVPDVEIHVPELDIDRLEITRFERPEQAFGDALVAHLQQFPAQLLDHAIRLRCPRHRDVTRLRRTYAAHARVEIDECPQCGGVWLDADELASIRDARSARP